MVKKGFRRGAVRRRIIEKSNPGIANNEYLPAPVDVRDVRMKKLLADLVRRAALILLRVVYRVRVSGQENLPHEGPALLIGNHVSYLDAIVVGLSTGRRPARFAVYDSFMKMPGFGQFLRLFNAIPISPTRSKDAIRAMAGALKEGDLVGIFPEGQITRHGHLSELKKGFELIARQADAPVVPVWLDQLWGSIFSYERGSYVWKWPRHMPYHVSVYFGDPIPAAEATAARARAAFESLAARALAERKELDHCIEEDVLATLRSRPFSPCLIEEIDGRRIVHRSAVVRAWACLLARSWRHDLTAERVAVALPRGVLSVVSHLALRLAGKVPVAVDPAADSATLLAHGLDTVLTAFGRASAFSGVRVVDAAEVFLNLSPAAIAAEAFIGQVPWPCRRTTGAAAAFLTAAGKLIELPHRSLLAQCEQFSATNVLLPEDTLDCREPVNSAAGQILGLWHPLRAGVPLALSGPASVLVSDQPVEGNPRAHLSLGTDAGLRGWVDDELGAILSLSQQDPPVTTSTAEPQPGQRLGSLGRLLPGFAPDFRSDGTLWLRGAGLPGADLQSRPTGARVRVDAEGFLFPLESAA